MPGIAVSDEVGGVKDDLTRARAQYYGAAHTQGTCPRMTYVYSAVPWTTRKSAMPPCHCEFHVKDGS